MQVLVFNGHRYGTHERRANSLETDAWRYRNTRRFCVIDEHSLLLNCAILELFGKDPLFERVGIRVIELNVITLIDLAGIPVSRLFDGLDLDFNSRQQIIQQLKRCGIGLA